MRKKRTPAIGETVKYAKPFLRSIGEPATGELWKVRGLVVGLEPFGDSFLARMDWGRDDIPERVNVCNLHIVGTLAASEA